MLLDIDDFLKLRNELPIVDVRSQGEYQDGHIRAAHNIPILDNAERSAVGTDYKQKGQLEAIKTGFRLVGPRLTEIIEAAENVSQGKELLVHCWRGGMRSANFCQFVGMAKVQTHQLRGGYKSYRTKAADAFKLPIKLIVLGGSTGSGKSEILRALAAKGEQILDLEQLANHRGSAFGGLLLPPQPTTEQFQNDLFEEILKLDLQRRVWIEDESIGIGKVFVPDDLWHTMGAAPIIEISVDKQSRVQRLVDEYGPSDKAEFLSAMEKITKKLGGQNFAAAKEKLASGDMHSTIEILLTYYDKAYQTGLLRKKDRIKSIVTWDGQNIGSVTESLMASTM